MQLSEIPVIYDGENLTFYYLQGNRIYMYNALTHETTLVFEAEDGLRFDAISWADDEQLAFLGQKRGSNYTYFGVTDLSNNEIAYDYAEFSGPRLNVYGNYLLLLEDRNERGEYRNEVIVFNLITHESTIIQVEDGESLDGVASVIADRFVLTTTLDRIRAYEIATNQIVLERSPLIELRRDTEFFTQTPRFITIKEGLLYGAVFEIEDFSIATYEGVLDVGVHFLHTEFIVIEE